MFYSLPEERELYFKFKKIVELQNYDLLEAWLEEVEMPKSALDNVFWDILETTSVEYTKLLVDNGADVNGYRCPLKWAVNGGNLPVVKYLIEEGANVNDPALQAELSGIKICPKKDYPKEYECVEYIESLPEFWG